MDIWELVERYRHNREAYTSGQYNETQLGREFLDPFFEFLRWNIDNKNGYAEPYKDVVHEDAIKIGVSTKAPDYSFRIGGTRKFFVEAKKPSIHIKDKTSIISTHNLFLLGLLNSRLLDFIMPSICSTKQGGYFEYKPMYVQQIPIKADNTDTTKSGQIKSLTGQMLILPKHHQAAKTAYEKSTIERQIDAADRQIDTLVYELHGLTEEEINIVEQKA